jgi:transcriptional regulator with XRE-family HTH domain
MKNAALPQLLVYWRRLRGMSQLALAMDAEISARHVSFLETGRSSPSRETLLVLASALDVPLRERNALFVAAGFAPVYRETNLDAQELAPARRAIAYILKQQEPYPAIVMDRAWNIIERNDAAQRFFETLVEAKGPPGAPNVLRSVFHPRGLRPWIKNWEVVAEDLVQRVHREAVMGVVDDATEKILAEVLAYPHVPERFKHPALGTRPEPLIALEFEKGDLHAHFFSTVTTLGTPQDVTLQEIRIECFHPADRTTEQTASRLAAGRGIGSVRGRA